jgi:signal transduction histidine kinase
MLAAQEVERQRLSRYLEDDVSQYLLGIHVRLLVLQKEVSDCHAGVAKRIAVTERLVAQSLKVIRRLERKGRAKP